MRTPDAEGSVSFLPVHGLREVALGADLAALLGEAVAEVAKAGDILVVTHKIVSKAAGRVAELAEVEPSALARSFAEAHGRDPRQVELVLRESRCVMRMARGLIISETPHGWVCANAGVDLSNAGAAGRAVLLPLDGDASARHLHERLSLRLGFHLPVIVTDSFGRPWRNGIVNVAIGVAGMAAVTDYRGQSDACGYVLSASVMATADALASGAELVMGKVGMVPAALVRGFDYPRGEGCARDLLLEPEKNLFP